MNDSSAAIEIANNKIKSLEKKKDVKILVEIIEEALIELDKSCKKEEAFTNERDIYANYVLKCLKQFVSDRKPNREVLMEVFNLDKKNKGRPEKKQDGWSFSFEEIRLFFEVGCEYEKLEGRKNLEKAFNVVAEKNNIGFEKIRKLFQSFGGLRKWREKKFKEEFF